MLVSDAVLVKIDDLGRYIDSPITASFDELCFADAIENLLQNTQFIWFDRLKQVDMITIHVW